RSATPAAISHLGIAFVPERDKVFPQLTIGEHINLSTARSRNARIDDLPPAFTNVLARRKLLAGALSGGQRQLLALLCAVLRDPKLLVVDEFSLGLAPSAVKEVVGALAWARAERGLSMLLVEQ